MNSRVCRISFWFGQGAHSCVAFIAVFAGRSAAMASCGDRPDTPDDRRPEAKSSTSIEFSWGKYDQQASTRERSPSFCAL
jgi:hypothetical protein